MLFSFIQMIIPVYNAKKKKNSKMIIKNVITKLFPDSELPNLVLRGASTPHSYLHVTGQFSDLHDGNSLTNTESLSTSHINVYFHFLSQRKVPKHTSALQTVKTSTGPWVSSSLSFNSLDDNDLNLKMLRWNINQLLFTKQQTKIQQRDQLQYLRMVTFIGK